MRPLRLPRRPLSQLPPSKRRRARARGLVIGALAVCLVLALARRRGSGSSGGELAGAAATTASPAPAPSSFPSSSGRRPCDRGVPPDSLARFCSAPTFTCDGGRTTLDATAVNDGYCDCADAADEPGTPACAGVAAPATLWFTCPGGGPSSSPPVRISRALVDDGVVDCPGGEDEWKEK